MATIVQIIEPFSHLRKLFWTVLGVSKEQPGGHCAWAEDKENREVNSRQNTQSLRGQGEESGFYSLTDRSHGRVSSKVGTYRICSLGDHSICFVEMGLLAGREAGRPQEWRVWYPGEVDMSGPVGAMQ